MTISNVGYLKVLYRINLYLYRETTGNLQYRPQSSRLVQSIKIVQGILDQQNSLTENANI